MTKFVGFPQDTHPFSAAEVGLALAGFVVRDAGVPRVGVLGDGPTGGVSGASWRVLVGPFVYVHQVSGAVQLSGSSQAELVDIVPSADIPSGQARIDVLCWDPVAAEFSVVEGVPAVSPVAPSVGSLAPLFRVRVNAGDGMVIAGQISPVWVSSGVVGARPVAYTPTISGYTSGFNPVVRAQYSRHGDVVEVEVQAVTEREVSRFTGNLLVSVPVPFGVSPFATDGGGFFTVGPAGAKRLYDLRARQASATQVVLEFCRTDGRVAELVPIAQAALASGDFVSWRARFRYSVG